MHALVNILNGLGHPRLLVLGDLILDRYTWGHAERVSPEASVLILSADREEVRLGGAASVASLLRGLDAEVALAGIVGDDANGAVVRRLLGEGRIDQELVLTDPSRPTTTKERFVGRKASRFAHQILRVDHETCQPIRYSLEEQLAQGIIARLNDFQAVLVSDYQKGVCTPGLLRVVIQATKDRGLSVLVDPARIADYQRYQGATLLVPNRAEAAFAIGQATINTTEEAMAAARHLRKHTEAQAAIVKLDSDGMVYALADGQTEHIATRPRDVHDVTGAGDMVLAVLGLAQAEGVCLDDAIRLANVAAGLEVQRLGVALVAREEIETDLTEKLVAKNAKRQAPKFVTLDEMEALANAYRQQRRSIVLTNGCFDLLHVGHVRSLEQAARLGDILIAAVNSDRSVRELKGSDRPVICQDDRAQLLASLACVDHVLTFDEPTPQELVRRIRPDVLVKGGTYSKQEVVGHEFVESYGGQVVVTDAVPGVSTTNILAAVHQAQAARSRTNQKRVR
jgi:D-beta-D-heptose 7-phosphate kinase/D-beta-D-heptose 1-phosphate adenosyltransferase